MRALVLFTKLMVAVELLATLPCEYSTAGRFA